MFNENILDENKHITEQDLILPILMVLYQSQKMGYDDGLTTPQIRDAVAKVTVASEEDKRQLSKGEIRLERMIRNAISSHKTLSKKGFASTDSSTGKTVISPKGVLFLTEKLLSSMEEDTSLNDLSKPENFKPFPALSEKDLILPALMVLGASYFETGKPVSTAQLIQGIMTRLPLGQDDVQKMPSGDIRVIRLMRNLRSHNTLIKENFAVHQENEKQNGFVITEKGLNFLTENLMSMFPPPPIQAKVPARKSTTLKV